MVTRLIQLFNKLQIPYRRARLIQSFKKWQTFYFMFKELYSVTQDQVDEAKYILERLIRNFKDKDAYYASKAKGHQNWTVSKQPIPEHLKFTPPAGLSPEEQLAARKAHIMSQATIRKPKEFVGLCNDRLVTGYEQESENSWWAYYHGRQGELITIGRFPTEQEAKEATRALFTHVDECFKTFKSIVDANAGGK